MSHPLATLGFRFVERQGARFWTPACLVQAGDMIDPNVFRRVGKPVSVTFVNNEDGVPIYKGSAF